jgi:hypothetical protein
VLARSASDRCCVVDDRLPNSKLDDAGHFTWEDAADEYAQIVSSWWAEGYARAVGRAQNGDFVIEGSDDTTRSARRSPHR